LLGLNNNNFYYKKAQLSDYYFIKMNLSILLVLMINQYLPSQGTSDQYIFGGQ